MVYFDYDTVSSKDLFTFILCVCMHACVFGLCVCMYTINEPGACGGLNRASDPQECQS